MTVFQRKNCESPARRSAPGEREFEPIGRLVGGDVLLEAGRSGHRSRRPLRRWCGLRLTRGRRGRGLRSALTGQGHVFVEEHDTANPLGIKGVGEIGTVGTAAAIANAVYHATGVRVRDLPITVDKLL